MIEDFVIFRVVGSIDHAMDFRSVDVIVHLILQSIVKESNNSARYRSNVLSLSSRKNVTLYESHDTNAMNPTTPTRQQAHGSSSVSQ